MKNGLVFAKIERVDAIKGEVHGIIAEEQPDKDNEIFDYATSVPHFKAWMATAKSLTGGKSAGNLRAMHSNIAAGKLTDMSFDDSARQIAVVAKVIDKNELEKLAQGVYTGFSIGGRYAKKWDDGELKRYTAVPSEVSLVDNPCMYGATFTAVKGDGVEIQKVFHPDGKASPEAQKGIAKVLREELDKREFKFARALPILKYLSGEVTELSLPLEKGLYTIADLATLIETLDCIRRNNAYEQEWEGDYDSALPARLTEAVKLLSEILAEMVEEETSELMAMADKPGMEKVAARKMAELLEKIGRKHSEKTISHLDGIKQHVDALLASDEEPADGGADETSEKLAKAKKEAEMEKELAAKQEALSKSQDEMSKRYDDLKKSFDEFKTSAEAFQKSTEENLERLCEVLEKAMNVPVVTRPAVTGAPQAIVKTADGLGKEGEVKAIKKNDGTDNPVATAFKQIHAGGAKPLTSL